MSTNIPSRSKSYENSAPFGRFFVRLFLLHRDFVIPMFSLAESKVRDYKIPNQPQNIKWSYTIKLFSRRATYFASPSGPSVMQKEYRLVDREKKRSRAHLESTASGSSFLPFQETICRTELP